MGNCPSCGNNDWEEQDYKITNSYLENSTNNNRLHESEGVRNVKQFTCKECNYAIQFNDDQQDQSEKTSLATCGGEHGTAFSNNAAHSHENSGNSS